MRGRRPLPLASTPAPRCGCACACRAVPIRTSACWSCETCLPRPAMPWHRWCSRHAAGTAWPCITWPTSTCARRFPRLGLADGLQRRSTRCLARVATRLPAPAAARSTWRAWAPSRCRAALPAAGAGVLRPPYVEPEGGPGLAVHAGRPHPLRDSICRRTSSADSVEEQLREIVLTSAAPWLGRLTFDFRLPARRAPRHRPETGRGCQRRRAARIPARERTTCRQAAGRPCPSRGACRPAPYEPSLCRAPAAVRRRRRRSAS